MSRLAQSHAASHSPTTRFSSLCEGALRSACPTPPPNPLPCSYYHRPAFAYPNNWEFGSALELSWLVVVYGVMCGVFK
jgi:hypothetical protein